MKLILALLMGLAGAASAQNPPGEERLIVEFEQGLTSIQRRAILARRGWQVLEDLDPLPAVVVKKAAGVVDPQLALQGLDPRITNVEADFYAKWIEELPGSLREIPMPSVAELAAKAPPAARQAEPQQIPWGISRVKAPGAWGITRGLDVKVAVLDTGVGPHPDLKVAGGYDARTFSLSKSYADDHGHGTHVAGTIAALMNDVGVVGVAPEAKIYAVKVLDKNGSGWATDIVKGITWCAKNKMDVVNMSLGSPRGLFLMRWALMLAKAREVVVVAAAGNNGEFVEYPGAYAETIAVAASDSSDRIADFSSRGKMVEFIAPGVEVLSTLPGGAYARYSGTSMATPHVAGLAAIAVSRGARGLDQVRQALKRAAVPIPGLKPEEQGSGMIDASKLIR